MAPPSARAPRGRVPLLPLGVLAAVAVTCAVGLGARAAGIVWGAPLQPFLGRLIPEASAWALLAAGVLALSVLAAPRLADPLRVRPAPFVAGTLALAAATRLTVATAREGPAGIYAVFDVERSGHARNEYLPALGAFEHGTRYFLDRFAEIVPSLPVHAAGHPPGLLLTLHALGIESPEGMAALVIAVGVLAAPLAYALGRILGGEERGRLAALLWVFAPSALLYTASSADALFATLGLAACTLLVAPGAVSRAAGAGTTAVAAFFAYSLLGNAAWAAAVVWRREGLGRALALGAACGVALAAGAALLWAVTGYDAPGALRATEQVYRNSIAAVRPYAFWVFGSPAAFLVALGLPIAWYALRALAEREAAALALAAVVVVASVAGFTKAETERIWLPFVPLACVAAAAVLPRRRLGLVVALLGAQALAAELLVDTVW